jgi:predicted Zn-dependent peptidase
LNNTLSLIGLLRFVVIAFTALAVSSLAAEIPERPEKLQFPAISYEPPDPAAYRVELKAGPVAYVIEDRELPLVTVSVLVRTGQYVEPADKAGLAALTGSVLASGGAGSRTAEELDERVDFLAAMLTASIGEAQGQVRLNLLSKDLEDGMQLLRDVLATPRFQENRVALAKEQTLQGLKQRNDDSADIEDRERDRLAYGADTWLNRLPTAASIQGIGRADLETFHRRWFHPRNMVIAVSGDFARADMVARLEKLLADWPFPGEPAPPIPAETEFAKPGFYIVNKDVNQGRVSLLLPGLRREHPDFLPVTVMNDILGGGGFTSRIMNRVRSEEGLAYSAGSMFPEGMTVARAFQASFQTKSRTVAYATQLVLSELKKIATEAVSEDELTTAKASFIDTFPRRFANKAQVAGQFASDEFSGRYERDPGFWRDYRRRIGSVNREDVQRMAAKWLQTDRLVVLAVGQKEEILKGHPDHPVKLEELTRGPLVDLPLRDPLTLEPK